MTLLGATCFALAIWSLCFSVLRLYCPVDGLRERIRKLEQQR